MYINQEHEITRIRTRNTLLEYFEAVTGLKHGDDLSPFLFNIALEKLIRNMLLSNIK